MPRRRCRTKRCTTSQRRSKRHRPAIAGRVRLCAGERDADLADAELDAGPFDVDAGPTIAAPFIAVAPFVTIAPLAAVAPVVVVAVPADVDVRLLPRATAPTRAVPADFPTDSR